MHGLVAGTTPLAYREERGIVGGGRGRVEELGLLGGELAVGVALPAVEIHEFALADERPDRVGASGDVGVPPARSRSVPPSSPRLQLLDDLGDLFHWPRFAGMDRCAQPLPTDPGEQALVIGGLEVGRFGACDIDTDDATSPVGDCFLGNDLVQLIRKGPVQAEDQARIDRVLEDSSVHAADCGADDVVEVLLAAAVALHGIEAQLDGRDVVLAVCAADDLVDRALDGDRRTLDQLRPVEELQVAIEAAAAARGDRDELAELPVILGREPDALGVRDAPHDCRRDCATEMGVELGQGPVARQNRRHAPMLSERDHSLSGSAHCRP